MASLFIQLGQLMSQKEAETIEENWTQPLAKLSGVSVVTSSQQERWCEPDIEQTSFKVVSICASGTMEGGGGVREEMPGFEKKLFFTQKCKLLSYRNFWFDFM